MTVFASGNRSVSLLAFAEYPSLVLHALLSRTTEVSRSFLHTRTTPQQGSFSRAHEPEFTASHCTMPSIETCPLYFPGPLQFTLTLTTVSHSHPCVPGPITTTPLGFSKSALVRPRYPKPCLPLLSRRSIQKFTCQAVGDTHTLPSTLLHHHY